MFRLEFKKGKNWLIGRIEYDSPEKAEQRANYFRKHGKQVRVCNNHCYGLD